MRRSEEKPRCSVCGRTIKQCRARLFPSRPRPRKIDPMQHLMARLL